MDNLQAYYAKRAAEYERIYAKPERQADLAALRSRIPALLARRSVLEVACGTGYWTEVIAPHVRSITAIDYVEETLAIARSKKYPANRVEFAQGCRGLGLPVALQRALVHQPHGSDGSHHRSTAIRHRLLVHHPHVETGVRVRPEHESRERLGGRPSHLP